MVNNVKTGIKMSVAICACVCCMLLLHGLVFADANVADKGLAGYEMYAESDALELYFNPADASVAVLGRQTGDVWFSNPPDWRSRERIARGQAKERVGSQLFITYYTPKDTKVILQSYRDSVGLGQVRPSAIEGGVRVEYTFGREWDDEAYLPRIVSRGAFEDVLLESVDPKYRSLYTKYFTPVRMVEVDADNPAVEVYGLNTTVFQGYTLVSPGRQLSVKDREKLVANFVDQLIANNSELSTRSDIESSHISLALIDSSAYVLDYSNIKAWDREDMIAGLKDMGMSPLELLSDHEIYCFDLPQPNEILFRIAVEYRLDGSSLVVRIPAEDISYPRDVVSAGGKPESYPLHSMDVLPYFGSASMDEQGYIFVPDGSGALIYLNSGRLYAHEYQSPVYGRDNSLTSIDQPLAGAVLTRNEQIHLPVFGLRKGDQSFISVIEQGQMMCRVNADIAGRSDSFNKVYPTIVVTPVGEMRLESEATWRSVTTGSIKAINVYQSRQTDTDYQLRYMFLSGDDSDYSGMASAYQAYLVDRGVLEPLAVNEGDVPLVLELVGAIRDKRPIVGVSREVSQPLTTFSQAETIVKSFVDQGVSSLKLKYSGLVAGGLRGSIDRRLDLEKSLGSRRDFGGLVDTLRMLGIGLYVDANFMNVYQDKWFDGFSVRSDAARVINGQPTRIIGYSPVSGGRRTAVFASPYVLSPQKLPAAIASFIEDLQSHGVSGISMSSIATQVDSDFHRDPDRLIDRSQALCTMVGQLAGVRDGGFDVMVSAANDYALPYVDVVTHVPEKSSEYNLLDRSIPFYQMVLHGHKTYTGLPMNELDVGSLLFRKLKVIELGACPYYRLFYEDSSAIKNTDFDYLLSGGYSVWFRDAVEFYSEVSEVLGDVQAQRITKHREVAKGVFETVYEHGKTIVVNYNKEDVEVDGVQVPGRGYSVRVGVIGNEAD